MRILRKRSLCSLALAASLIPALPAHAYGAGQGSRKRAEGRAARPGAALERSKALEQVRAFAERVQSFQDAALKVDGLVALAAVLWKEGGDAEYARQLFIDTHDFLKTFQPKEVKDSLTGAAPAGGALPPSPSRKTLRLLRRRLITNLAKFDPPLANRLAGEQDGYFETPLDADEFKDRTREQLAREDFDKLSSAKHLGRNEALIVLSILDEFRKKDVKAGDSMFLSALNSLRAQQNVEADALLILGNYLFSGHPLPTNEAVSRIMVSPVQVGGVSLAADVVLNRENFTPSLVPPYLTAAADILSRTAEDAGERRRYGAAAALLLPKAKEFAPQLVPAFAGVVQRLGAGLTASAAGQVDVKRWANEKIDLELTLGQIRKAVGTKEHDRLCLTAAAQYSAQKDLNAARRVAGEITDEAARAKLLSILDFKQASDYLRDGDLARAEEAGARISSETVRALFYVGLAATHLRAGRADAAKAVAGGAITDARKSVDAARRPFLLLMAAAALSKPDAPYSLQLFREALDELDASGYAGRPAQIVEFGWVETVGVEGKSVRFELQPGPKSVPYAELLENLFAADRRTAVAAVSGLKTEALLSAHLIAASRILLETPRIRSYEAAPH